VSIIEEREKVRGPLQGKEAIVIPWVHFRVPPFPATALRVLELTGDERASIHQLSQLISSDPVFSTEVLAIANSALIAHRLSVTSVLQAVAMLGTHNLSGVCLTVAVRAYLGKSMGHRSLYAIWRHSLAAALIAERIAIVGLMNKDKAYTGGIVHDIGRFALAALRPKEYAELLGNHCGNADSILEPERGLFGFDHCQVGQHLVRDWQLPKDFATFVSPPNSARREGGHWEMIDVVHMGCRMADSAGFAAFAGCEVTPYGDLFDQLPSRERSLFPSDIAVLTEEISHRINAIESL
jgi:HD-like signal output (HDOD) protein